MDRSFVDLLRDLHKLPLASQQAVKELAAQSREPLTAEDEARIALENVWF